MSAIALAPTFDARERDPHRRLTLVRGTRRATRTISVAVAAGHAVTRAGVRVLLERAGGISVVGEAGSGEEVVDLSRRTRPDVVVLDVHLPGLGCVRATRDILTRPGTAVMLLAGSKDDDRILRALRAGARGLLLEHADPTELVRAVTVLAHGATALPPTFTRQLAGGDAGQACPVIPLPTTTNPRTRTTSQGDPMLTPRVTEIRRVCAHGTLVQVPKPPAVSLAPAR